MILVKHKYPMLRENWFLQMNDFGNKGVDFNKTSNKVIAPTKKLIERTNIGYALKKLDPTLDVKGYDMPRDDIKSIHLKNGKVIYVGGTNISHHIKQFKKYILPYINKSFTSNELKGLDIYIEYPSHNITAHFSGTTEGFLSNKHKKVSTVQLQSVKDVPAAVHEIIHTIKFKRNIANKNVHIDEAETILEENIRLGPKLVKKIPCGDSYYTFVKGNKCKARDEDIELIKSSCNIRNKNGLTRCIKKNIHKTHIGKLKIPKKYIPKM